MGAWLRALPQAAFGRCDMMLNINTHEISKNDTPTQCNKQKGSRTATGGRGLDEMDDGWVRGVPQDKYGDRNVTPSLLRTMLLVKQDKN